MGSQEQHMTTSLRWTSADLTAFPDNGNRYEIVDGDLYVSKQPSVWHQSTCGIVFALLQGWSNRTDSGFATIAPGIIFGEDDDVAPDVVWVSKARQASVLGPDGKLYAAPDLVVEVLSPGASNERRDREVKLELYSRRGVKEYWIIDWRGRQLEVYRREHAQLRLHSTLLEEDALDSPLLPGFICAVSQLFEGLPPVGQPTTDSLPK
jgi:Uma2 family endonuclease